MTPDTADIPRRPFGPDRIPLSVIGMGGIVSQDKTQDGANRFVAEMVERGINYFDVAPSYGKGMAEKRLGPALEPYRDDCFLACKTMRRDRAGAEEEIRTSLERLRTDRFDLFQLHALTDVEKDVEAAFAKGGVMELVDAMRRDGRARHVGFSAHSTDAALAAMDRYDFDSILVPINYASWLAGGFGPAIVETAQAKGVSILALKAMARHRWPDDDPLRQTYTKTWYRPIDDAHEAELALKFTLSKPVTAAVPPGEEKPFRLALDLVNQLDGPITEAETDELRKLANVGEPVFSR
jgi:aryl-alcohol dehydrogenase-like predicted oxidoreductase